MSRPVLAPLAVTLSALLLAPVVSADPSAPLFLVEQQRATVVSRLVRQWADPIAALPKERRLDGIATLERLSTLPVYRWVAKDDPRRPPHAGPTAQDFMAAFGLGDNDRMIGFADAQGIAFAAIQGLNARLAEKDREIAELKRAVEILLLRTSSDGRAAEAPKARPSPGMSTAKMRTKERT
jgi:hypothetical protein